MRKRSAGVFKLGFIVIAVLVLGCMFVANALAETTDKPQGIQVEAIAPEQLVEKANEVGDNLITLGKGVAPLAATIGIIAAVILIFIGLPLLGITKFFFRTGILVVLGVVVLYLFTNYSTDILGVFKGILGAE